LTLTAFHIRIQTHINHDCTRDVDIHTCWNRPYPLGDFGCQNNTKSTKGHP